MPKVIQTGAFVGALRDRFRLVGRTKFGLDETVVPTTLIADLSTAPFSPKTGGDSLAAGAGGFLAKYSLTNPADSQTMIVLDAFMGEGDTAAEFWQMRIEGAQLANFAVTSTSRDMRQDPLFRVGLIGTEMSALITGTFNGVQWATRTNETFVLRQEWYIPPGSNVLFMSLSNRATKACFFWREVDLQEFGL